MLWLLLLASAEANCPDYRCAELVSGRCAEIYGDVVFVNTRACPSGEYCWASEIARSYALGEQYVDCTSEDRGATFIAEDEMCAKYDSYYSGFRLPERLSHPWLCASDDECVLHNGQAGACVCSLGGSQYCALQVGDSLLHDWAKRFSCNGERRYSALLDYAHGYAYMQGNRLSCEDNLEEVARAKPFHWVLPEQFTFETEPNMSGAVYLLLTFNFL